MENTSENGRKKIIMKASDRICLGILAHVDAGKTTLAESILYLSGSIRKWGRVDHRDAFLDTDEMERARGITIFSKQAQFVLGDGEEKKEITLLDTPGHVDFSTEMERTLQVLDYAVLVISGADGIQGHVDTLWRLLSRYRIPVFLFINKMDQPGTDKAALLDMLQKRLDGRCVDFDPEQPRETFYENVAMCEERALESYLEKGRLEREEIIGLIQKRRVFPCFFGSALKMWGVEEFLQGFSLYTRCPAYPDEFGAKVFKIARDGQGNRLTYMKITGGSLKVKMLISNGNKTQKAEDNWEEKADQIRIYSGASYRTLNEALAGCVCAVTGLTKTWSGEGLGIEAASRQPVLEPVLTYEIRLPQGADVYGTFLKLRQLEEEDPMLHLVWNEALGEIHAQVMGEVQIDILKHMILERFGLEVEFSQGSIVYKETIKEPVEGVGHFEPLRHYAEVHLLMEPGEPGSGLQFDTVCSEDQLAGSWQRLILTHLKEKRHVGVLTGGEITDMKITLTAGRAHLKHTEGGDFRQATYRAVRQGLKMAKSVLLEPIYQFRLEIPSEAVGRALTDIQKMEGSFGTPVTTGEWAVISGTAPVSTMRGYQREVSSYSRGRGRLSLELAGYAPCHNDSQVIAAAGYDPEADQENPTGSVFCSHGAGFVVNWDQVRSYMHLDTGFRFEWELSGKEASSGQEETFRTEEPPKGFSGASLEDDKELMAIFERTYGPVKRQKNGGESRPVKREYGKPVRPVQKKPRGEEYLLVDGYNIIFAWEELNDLAKVNIEAARNKLMDILSNYQGYKKMTLILVFDAYKVEGGQGSVFQYHNIYVVFTKEAETADQYIEKTVHRMEHQHQVTVATSDATEQVIILGQGARRLSARDLLEEVMAASAEIRSMYLNKEKGAKSYLLEHLPEKEKRRMEDIRLGKEESYE